MAMVTRRHWLTGELETVDVETGVFRYGRSTEDQNVPVKTIPAITPTNPLISTAISIIPSQVKSMNKAVRDAGVTGVHYRKDGKAVFESNAARNSELRRRDKFDGDAGYSQHAGSG